MRSCLAALFVLAAVAVAPAEEQLPRGGFLGVMVGPAEGDRAGLVVKGAADKSSAADAGLKAGDVIVRVDEKEFASVSEFLDRVRGRKEGDSIKLAFVRDGKEQTVDIRLKPRPHETNAAHATTYGSVRARAGLMRTITTRPKGEGKHPVLFIIQGLGGYSIESAPAGPGMYAPFVDAFDKAGWMTFRVDKPGQGDSQGGPTRDVDFETELDTYRQALKALKQTEGVDPDRIVILGHSMGGVMGPIIASETPVRGVAAYGTMSKTWIEYMLENVRRQMIIEGAAPSAIDKAMREDAAIHYLLCLGGKSPEEIVKEFPSLAGRVPELIQDGKYLAGRDYRFFRQLQARNLAEAWEKHEGHALGLWGKGDFVSAEADHQWIAEIANRRRKGLGRSISLDGVDHGFEEATSQAESRSRLGKPGGKFNPIVVKTLLEWAEEIVKDKA